MPVLGVVENMSGFVCPKCGEVTQILPSGGGKRIAEDMDVPFLGPVPMDPEIAAAGDRGGALLGQDPTSPMARVLSDVVRRVAGPPAVAISQSEGPGGK